MLPLSTGCRFICNTYSAPRVDFRFSIPNLRSLRVRRSLSVVIPSMIIVLAACEFIDLLNRLIIAKIKVNAVAATLGTGRIVVGLNIARDQGVLIASGPPGGFKQPAIGQTFGIRNNILIMAVVLFLPRVFVDYTEWGLQLRHRRQRFS